jgi:UDP-N-acetylmuramate dehydrogenase
MHANFIVNNGNAMASDIIELISIMRRRVYEAFGVYLELENEILDSFSQTPAGRPFPGRA